MSSWVTGLQTTTLEEALTSETNCKNGHRFFLYFNSYLMWYWSFSYPELESSSPAFKSGIGYVSGFGYRVIGRLVHNDLSSCYFWKLALNHEVNKPPVGDGKTHDLVIFFALVILFHCQTWDWSHSLLADCSHMQRQQKNHPAVPSHCRSTEFWAKCMGCYIK